MDVKEKIPPATTRPKNFLDNFLTCRRVLNIMVFLGFMVNYMLRVNLNFAIVDMVFRPDDPIVNLSTTPFSLPTLNGSEKQTRFVRSLSNAEMAAFEEGDDDDDDEGADVDRNFRKNNFMGTNGAAPKQSTATQNKPLATNTMFQSPGGTPVSTAKSGVPTFSIGSNANLSGGFQSFGSNSGGANQANGFQSFNSGSGGNPAGGFQSFSSGSGGNQAGGFQTSGSGSAGSQSAGLQFSGSGSASSNPAGGFQSSGNGFTSNNNNQSANKNQFSAAASGTSSGSNSNIPSSNSDGTQQSNEPVIQQTKVNNQFQAAPGTGQTDNSQSSNPSDQKVGSAANSLDDYIIGEEKNNDSHILFTKDLNKLAPEVGNAKLEDGSDGETTTAAPKKKKKKRQQKPNVQRFKWSEAEQGFLIGSFFWGYILTELPGGRLAEIIGARKVFGYATLGASVVTLLTPMFAKIHFILILIIRILLGLFLGPTWPSILPLAGKWIPMNERGKFLSNMMGSTLGAGFTLPICGFIIDTFSWEYVFYITGLLGFIWSILWFLLVFETPADHPRITPEERWYIESNLGLKPAKSSTGNNYSSEEKQVAQGLMVNPGDESCLSDNEQKSSDECRNYSTFARNGDVNNTNSDTKGASRDQKSSTGSIHDSNGDSFKKSASNVTDKKSLAGSNNANTDQNTSKKQSGHAKAPWAHIITSVPVWAFVLTHGASVFGYNTITNQLPTFMDHILNYEIKENGILSSFPYIGKYIAAVIGGAVADRLLRSSRFTKNFVRKLLTTIGVLVPGCLMLFQIFVGSDKTFSIFVFTAALTANGVVVGGYLGNSLDIAPNFSGTVFGLGNMFSGLSGAVSALLVGYLTDHNQVYGQWQKVFFIVATTYIVGALIFLIFGSTDVQPWNYPSEQNKKKNEADREIDEETSILQTSRRRSSVSSALRSYTEDEWDTSSYQSIGLEPASKPRKKRHRKKTRPDTEIESFDSSRKKHLRFEQSGEKSTLKPLLTDRHRDSDSLSATSSYADKDRSQNDRGEFENEVKLRKARGEKYSDEDYLLSIKKRASYKEAIENGSHSDYSYDSENKTRTPSTRQHQRKIKTQDSNDSDQTTDTMKKNTRKRSSRAEQISPSETTNEKKTRKNRHKNRKTSDPDTDEDENADDHSTKIKREAYSKKLKSPTSQQSTTTDESDSDDSQNGSKKRRKKFSIVDMASSQIHNISSKIHKSTKSKEKSLKNDPQPSTSSKQNEQTIDISPSGDDKQKPERKFHLPLSSQPQRTIRHTSSSPL